MNDKSGTVICVRDENRYPDALILSQRTGFPIAEAEGGGISVIFAKEGVGLSGNGLYYSGNFDEMAKRITSGKLQHEMLVHAAKTKSTAPIAVDATAGMGEDAFLLAAAGYEVTMIERDAVIAALLSDALRRAGENESIRPIIQRMHLILGNSTELLTGMQPAPELVYLDPMFPARKKSGLINKKLQLIQMLESPCVEENELFEAARMVGPRKIIVKRPLKGGYLAGKKADYSYKGKAIRYDCYAFPQNRTKGD